MHFREIDSIIFIRRDNIGDLVCTTPAIKAVRLKCPKARIAVLANSYNAGILEGNPDVDSVFIYEKEKHSGKGRTRVYLKNLNLLRKIRSERYTVAVGCSYGYSRRVERLAGLTGARYTIGPVPASGGRRRYTFQVDEPVEPIHEVTAMMRLLEPLGITGSPPGLSLYPHQDEVKKAARALEGFQESGKGKGIIAFHISSRRPENRWPAGHFVELARLIRRSFGADVLILWSPGSSSNPLHPGDDEAAEHLISEIDPRPLSYRTTTLAELMAVTSLVDMVVCSDGGAMHIAAALGKPVIAVWGSTDKRRWAPWGVPFVILQKESRQASSITANEAVEAIKSLYRTGSGAG